LAMSIKWRERMKLSLTELQIIERLLLNRLNAAYDPEVEELLCKVRKGIEDWLEETGMV